MRALPVAMLVLLLGAEGAAGQDLAARAPQSLVFTATRNGEPIGTHAVRIVDQGEQRTVTNAINLSVTKLGLTVYRYAHQSTELWHGERLQSLTATTEDNGAVYKVRVNRQGDALRVDREERMPVVRAPSVEQFLPAEVRSSSETQPGSMLPTALWSPRIATQASLLNMQHGAPSRIQVSLVGRETVRTSSRAVEATRYRFVGDLKFDQWFDDRGRWVKAVFTAPDGSLIDYTLQE